jgi:signal transduction histidine kinase
LERSVAPTSEAVPSFADEIARLRQRHAGVEFDFQLEALDECRTSIFPLLLTFINEGVRNATKHANPTRISIAAQRRASVLRVEIRNDGLQASRATPGVGLKLLGVGATQQGGVVHYGEQSGSWCLKLTLPH